MAGNLVDVYVKLPSGRTSVLHLRSYQYVSMINEHVADEEKVSDDLVILKYQGKVLNRGKTIGDYGIRPETILKGEVVKPQDITVSVKLPDGKLVRIQTRNTRPVSDILAYLKKNSSVNMKKYNLKITGQVLVNRSQALFDAGVSDQSVLGLEEKIDTSDVNFDEAAPEELEESVMSSFHAEGRRVEVVFSFDTTGSMASCIKTVRKNLKNTCKRLLRDIPNIRIGIIAHGDYCDYKNYVIRQVDLTSDVDSLVKFVEGTRSTGGGDAPECYEWVLHKAQQLDWSEDSAKALVVIGDCEPHPPSYTDQKINWWTELGILKGMGVKLYGVYCNQRICPAQKFYEEIAEQTGGCMLKLRHFNLITEMFLGVCYREAAPEQLEAFTEELEQEGKLTEEVKELMEEIADTKPEEKKEKKEEEKKRYVSEAWWDVEKLDKTDGPPQYMYDAGKNKWKVYSADKSNADEHEDGDEGADHPDDWGVDDGAEDWGGHSESEDDDSDSEMEDDDPYADDRMDDRDPECKKDEKDDMDVNTDDPIDDKDRTFTDIVDKESSDIKVPMEETKDEKEEEEKK